MLMIMALLQASSQPCPELNHERRSCIPDSGKRCATPMLAEPFRLEDLPKAEQPSSGLATRAMCTSDRQGEVVVCGSRESRYRMKDPLPGNPLLIDEVSDALVVRVGPVKLGSFRKSDGTRGFGVAMPF